MSADGKKPPAAGESFEVRITLRPAFAAAVRARPHLHLV